MNSNESGWFVAAIAIFMLVVVIVVSSGGSYVAPAYHVASESFDLEAYRQHLRKMRLQREAASRKAASIRATIGMPAPFVPSPLLFQRPRPFGHAFDSGLTFGNSRNCSGR